MSAVQIITIILVFVGLLLLFDFKIDIKRATKRAWKKIDTFDLPARRLSLKEYASERLGKRKKSLVSRNFAAVANMYPDDKVRKIKNLCRLGGIIGIIGGYAWNGILFSAVVGFVGYLVPLWIAKFISIRSSKYVTANVETALHAVTASYMRSEDIVEAVKENVDTMELPVKQYFKTFLARARLNADLDAALVALQAEYDNEVFREWVATLRKCIDNGKFKESLMPIVEKFSDIKDVQLELETILSEPIANFCILAAVSVINILIMPLMSKDWYVALMGSIVGKIIVASTLIVAMLGFNKAIELLEPPKVRR